MIHAVIGSHYGDEGKGVVTDYLTTPDSLIVRFNGGAQAGHTVVTPDGRRHEFHHVGAGAFRHAYTFLSRFFVVNPVLFNEEWMELAALDLKPVVCIDPNAQVTTPYDMLLNQAVERARGDLRHGSCGVGINETVTRAAAGFGLTVSHVWCESPREVWRRLRMIETEYVPNRALTLGVSMPVWGAETAARFANELWAFGSKIYVRDGVDVLRDWNTQYGDIVFEGAQGLRLDEIHGTFPYVTRSRTGLTNVVTLLREAEIDRAVAVHYVTRTYVTRHGPGPLPFEVDGHPFGWSGPETNVFGEWQRHLRYAPLSMRLLEQAVLTDLACAAGRIDARPDFAVTCADQLSDRQGDRDAWVAKRFEDEPIPVAFVSHGPTRNDVERKEVAVG